MNSDQVIGQIVKRLEDFIVSTDLRKDFPCQDVSLKYFSLEEAKDSILNEASPPSVEGLAIDANSCLVLFEFKNPWSKYIESFLKNLLFEVSNRKNLPTLRGELLLEWIEKEKSEDLLLAIRNTIRDGFKLREKLESSYRILSIICRQDIYPVKKEYVILIDITNDFAKSLLRGNPLLSRLRGAIPNSEFAFQFLKKNLWKVMEFIRNKLKDAVDEEECKAVPNECICMDCGGFKIYVATTKFLFPVQD